MLVSGAHTEIQWYITYFQGAWSRLCSSLTLNFNFQTLNTAHAFISNVSIHIHRMNNTECRKQVQIMLSVSWIQEAVIAIQPLSGTSSFSNDTVRFTRFLFTMAIAYKSLLFGELKFAR